MRTSSIVPLKYRPPSWVLPIRTAAVSATPGSTILPPPVPAAWPLTKYRCEPSFTMAQTCVHSPGVTMPLLEEPTYAPAEVVLKCIVPALCRYRL